LISAEVIKNFVRAVSERMVRRRDHVGDPESHEACREIREIPKQALRAFKDVNLGAIEVVKSSMQGAVEALGANSRWISRRVRLSAISVGISATAG
jgi:hypothetical protein